jgi:hypothetical protein
LRDTRYDFSVFTFFINQQDLPILVARSLLDHQHQFIQVISAFAVGRCPWWIWLNHRRVEKQAFQAILQCLRRIDKPPTGIQMFISA